MLALNHAARDQLGPDIRPQPEAGLRSRTRSRRRPADPGRAASTRRSGPPRRRRTRPTVDQCRCTPPIVAVPSLRAAMRLAWPVSTSRRWIRNVPAARSRAAGEVAERSRARQGRRQLRLMHLGAGHTLDDELIYVEQGQVLITGDIVQNKPVPIAAAPGATYASWLTVLEGLSSLHPVLVIRTHSPVGDADLIPRSRSISDIRDRLAALKSGLSAEDAAPGSPRPSKSTTPTGPPTPTGRTLAPLRHRRLRPPSRPGGLGRLPPLLGIDESSRGIRPHVSQMTGRV